MDKVHHLFLTILFIIFLQVGRAADFSKWKLYPSYNDITEIEPTGKRVFVLASGSLFSYNPTDASLTTYDKINGLSDNDVSHIKWAANAGKLVIAYKNANIDLITTNGEVTNIPGLYQKETTFDKDINNIYVYDKSAYLATKFGVVKLNLTNGTIQDTYQLGFTIDYCYIDNGYLYASSSTNGLYRGLMQNNLFDASNWTRVGEYTSQNIDRKNVYDSANKYWWTTNESGKLTYYKLDENNERTYLTEGILPDGPASNNFYHLYFNNNKLYATGGMWSQLGDRDLKGEVHVWDGNQWSEFESPTEEPAASLCKDYLCLDFDPKDNEHVMVGTKNGLYEFKNGKFVNLYNKENSNLSAIGESNAYTLVTSVKYDANGNLWVLNPLGDTERMEDAKKELNAIKCLTSDGQWKDFEHTETKVKNVFDLEGAFLSKKNGLMWFLNNKFKNIKLYAYNTNEDQLSIFGPTLTNQDNSTINASYAFTPVEDKEGNIWIVTDVGPIYLSTEAMSNGEKYFTQYKVPRNDGTNHADYLLSGVSMLSIAIDGGNQKWFGTSGSGVFLVSADNNTQIDNFTTSNSPLPSNTILNIAINEATGEVFFATDKGLCSYKSDITESVDEMTKDNIYAYPNPVHPEYTGKITIVGLSYNADVKIVTANGTLVNQGRSIGGSYSWDGKDLKGKRVASGMYMVVTATETGEKGTVCKIAVLN